MPQQLFIPTDVKKLLDIQEKKIVLDTNILIQGTEGKTENHRKWIRDFCEQNFVVISDTVFYEFLRNCNFNNFRKRRVLVEDWPSMKPMRILREDKSVKEMREHIAALYLHVMRDDPKRFLHLCKEDLWIAAAAAHYDHDEKIDRILTTDHSSDFPKEIFSDESFDLGNGLVVHLKTFRRVRAREMWMEMTKAGKIEVNISSLL